MRLLLISAIIPIAVYANCEDIFSEVAPGARQLFWGAKGASKGDVNLSELIVLAGLLDVEIQKIGAVQHSFTGQEGVGEISDLKSPFVYFDPSFIETPIDSLSGNTDIRNLLDRVEIPNWISKFISALAHNLAGVRSDGSGAPRMDPSEIKKQRYIETEILSQVRQLSHVIPKTAEDKERQESFDKLIRILESSHIESASYNEAKIKFSLTNGMGIYGQIYDQVARELIHKYSELPMKIRRKLLALVKNPEAELNAEEEFLTDKYPESLFKEVWIPPTSESFTELEIRSGAASGLVLEKEGFFKRSSTQIPITFLKELPETNSWLVVPTAQLKNTFRDSIVIYEVSNEQLRVSSFPERHFKSQYEISNEEPSFGRKHDRFLLDAKSERQSFALRLSAVFKHLGVTSVEKPGPGQQNNEARLRFILEGMDIRSPIPVEETEKPFEPSIVSRYPDIDTLAVLEKVLKAIVVRDFLLKKGGRELRAHTMDLKGLELFFTLNRPKKIAEDGAPNAKAQIASIEQEKQKFRKYLADIQNEISSIKIKYGISALSDLFSRATTTQERLELFEVLGDKLLDIEEAFKPLYEPGIEQQVFEIVHSDLYESLMSFAGPKNQSKAKAWFDKRRTKRKHTPSALKRFIEGLDYKDRKLVSEAVDSRSFEWISIVEPGERVKFQMAMTKSHYWDGELKHVESKKTVVLTKPFIMQATDVTQAQWAGLMGANPSHFKNSSTSILLNGIEVDPNRPVENVSLASVLYYCNKLSENEGLEPYYDFRELNVSGSAKDGTLHIDTQYFKSSKYIINSKSNGYRLPTQAELDYAAKAGSTTRYFFGDNEDPMQYGYFKGNSQDTTQPVAQLKPNAFGLYDVYGNVSKWTGDRKWSNWDGYWSQMIYGGDYGSSKALHHRWDMHAIGHSRGYPNVGFRVVRTP